MQKDQEQSERRQPHKDTGYENNNCQNKVGKEEVTYQTLRTGADQGSRHRWHGERRIVVANENVVTDDTSPENVYLAENVPNLTECCVV